MVITEFPPSVIEKLGYYVYLLKDPETDVVFYVDKGRGNRIFSHINAALTSPTDRDKLNKIREIRAKGLEVKHEILRHGLTEKEAFEIEAALIDYIGLPELTNLVAGYEAFGRGRMPLSEILAIYQATPIEIIEPVMLILVNVLYERNIGEDRLYEITRGNWVVGERRNKARYAFAVYNGVVRQVYKVHKWETIRDADKRTSNRWRFDGEVALFLQHYVGRSVEKYLKTGAQNPIKYVNC